MATSIGYGYPWDNHEAYKATAHFQSAGFATDGVDELTGRVVGRNLSRSTFTP
jgi:hypothetical protein